MHCIAVNDSTGIYLLDLISKRGWGRLRSQITEKKVGDSKWPIIKQYLSQRSRVSMQDFVGSLCDPARMPKILCARFTMA